MWAPASLLDLVRDSVSSGAAPVEINVRISLRPSRR